MCLQAQLMAAIEQGDAKKLAKVREWIVRHEAEHGFAEAQREMVDAMRRDDMAMADIWRGKAREVTK
jgi:hypothetical protein